MAKIIEFGLPRSFPDALVPPEAARFCAEVDGMEYEAAVDLAHARGLAPITAPLRHLGPDVWGFGLDFDGLSIPFMVRVSEAGHVQH